MDVVIEVLSHRHHRETFDCGYELLDNYLKHYATQDIKRRLNRVFVAVDSNSSGRLCAYYGLCAGTVDASSLPQEMSKRLPKYPVPVVLLSRLAVDREYQGQGLGTIMLVDALRRIIHASDVLAVYAVVVDAIDVRAADFYKQFGYIPLPSNPLKLFIPVDSIRQLVE
ncbi:MAG: GNAT family N-acetyltransferase [Pseudohongiella sp.]|nr:GNAT family N-acetyltransferase [Pseudohongiella sp.]